MKIIMRILFIYLVFYSSISAKVTNEFYVTFEMMKGSSDYLDIMQEKIETYSKRGLSCYTVEDGNAIYLRCNDTKTVQDYKDSIALLDGLNLHYKVVSIEKPSLDTTPSYNKVTPNIKEKEVSSVSSSITLKDGYKEYNAGNYVKAKKIFSKLYHINNNLENSYAMGLIALHTEEYPRVREYLKPYLKSKKVNKLYYDSIVAEYYAYIKYGSNSRAISLKNRYKNRYPELKKLATTKPKINLGDGYKAFNAKEYKKAKKIFKKLYKEKTDLETSYAMALVSLNEKNYSLVRKYLKPYRKSSKKTSTLYYDSIVNEYYSYVNSGDNTKAYELKKKYILSYPKLKSLAEPKSDINLGDGYKAYNNKEYKKADKIFTKLYKKNKNIETAYAISLVALNKKNYPLVRNYLNPYTKSSKKASKLFYDSIVTQYYSYLKVNKKSKALRLVQKYKNKYPKLNKLEKPKSNINLGTGYKAYNKKEFSKAKKIFSQLYKKDKNLENSYAMGLVYLNEKQFNKMRNVLNPYAKTSKKVSKLYYDSILNEYYLYRSNGDNKKALRLLSRYKLQYPQLSKINDALLEDANKYIAKGEFYKAEELLTNNGYQNTQEYIFEKKYEKATQLRGEAKDFEALEIIMPYLSTHTKAAKLYADVTISIASLYLENKNYNRAKNLLKPIAAISPKAEELYYQISFNESLEKGWTSFNNRQRAESLKLFEEACSISEQDSCLEGIMNASYKMKEYKKSLPSAKKVYKKNSSQDAAFIAYNSALKLENKKEVDYWYELLTPKNKKLALYRQVANNGANNEIDALYVKAIENNPYDFELVTNYLYFLKDAKLHKKFEEVLSNAQENFTATTDTHILTRIQREYQNTRFYNLYKEEKNQECFEYGNQILREKDDIGYKRMHAWCAFKSENYNSAERIFATINAKYEENLEDIYGQFISAFKDGNNKKAKKLLGYLSQSSGNDKDRIKIAQFYIQMNELDEARKITFDIDNQLEKENLQVKINKKYKYSKNEVDAVAGGVHYKRRSIEDGLHSFTQISIPLDFDYYTKKYGHYYVDADILSLFDEFEGSPQRYSLEQGLGWTYNENKSMTNSVFIPKIGAEFKYLTLELGSTPLGATISPELTGKFLVHTANETWNVSLGLLKTSIDDSMLSLVGVNYTDDGTDIEWGRVVKSGAELGLSYNSDLTYSLDVGYYPNFDGLNVVENEEFKVVGSVTYHMPTTNYSYLDYGFIAVYDSYDVNSDLYTYGHGGYFSPNDFFLGSFVVDIADISSEIFYWKARLSLGYETFKVNNQYKYPVKDNNTDYLNAEELEEVKDGYTENGITYKMAIGAGYTLTDQLDIVGALSFEEMKLFNVIEAGFSLVYTFEKKQKVNLYNLHNSHRVESTLR